MRSHDEYRKILQLWEAGHNKSEIEEKTGIPRTTVRDFIKKFGTLKEFEEYLHCEQESLWRNRVTEPDFRFNYAYMLGIYLGDGYIVKQPRTYHLRIYMDSKYSNIINKVMSAISILAPKNSIHTQQRVGCIEIGCCSNHWVEMFPQHGEGVKHSRAIILEDWQQQIVDEHLLEFVRGLYHSDGSRIEPKVNGKIYSRYQFSNVSEDIHRLFCDAVDKLGLNWTRWGKHVTIARRPDVAFLDEHIGPKS